LAVGYFLGDVLGGFGFVVVVVGNERTMKAEARQEAAGRAGVFAGHQVDGTEDRTSAL